ncbi:MAG: biopolymer transporter ExbD [Deltaproteobacteria bacterium]|nr:biopolymer transporter ExbD [Deltaproteobacteria bacterium]
MPMMTEINITPLTDVMLVLLVIFMVTTPLIVIESFKVRLPAAVTATAEPGKGVTISVSESGMIDLNGRVVPLDRLLDALEREFSLPGSDMSVLLKGDAAARHKAVVEVLDIARLAGASKLSIATEPAAAGRKKQ